MTGFGFGGWGEAEYDPHVPDEGGGEVEEPNSGEHLPDVINLGGGIRLRINPEYFRMIMHSPEITAMVDERCDALAAEANSLKVREDAEYVYQVSNNPDNIRARGRVKPGNFEAVLDDDEHSTLLKALATVGSDPLPPQYFAGAEDYQRYLDSHAEHFSEVQGSAQASLDMGDGGDGE